MTISKIMLIYVYNISEIYLMIYLIIYLKSVFKYTSLNNKWIRVGVLRYIDVLVCPVGSA